MNAAIWLILGAAVLCGVVMLLKIFGTPIRLALKLALNTLLGFAELVVLNFLGSLVGIGIGINLVNALVVAVLGIPGVFLLFLVKWLFGG